MKALYRKHKIEKNDGPLEILVVHLEGQIDLDSVDLFRSACRGPLEGRAVLFNFEKISCIGTSGLRSFLEAMNSLTKTRGSDVRFCQVQNDFAHILEATPLGLRPRFSQEAEAIRSYHFHHRDLSRSAPLLEG